MLGGAAAVGAFFVVRRVPGLGLAGASSDDDFRPDGTFGASFDFETGDVAIAGESNLPDGTPLDVTVTALLAGVPMSPGGDAALRTVRTTATGDGDFAAGVSFDGATDGTADQFDVVIEAGGAGDGLRLTGRFYAGSAPDGPDGPQLGPASDYTRSSTGSDPGD